MPTVEESVQQDNPGRDDVGGFARWIAGDDEPKASRFRLSVGEGMGADPERKARVIRMQMKTALPADLIDRNLDQIELESRKKDFDADAFARSSPLVAAWVAEHPDHAAVVQGDMDTLRQMESTLRPNEGVFSPEVREGLIRKAKAFGMRVTEDDAGESQDLRRQNAARNLLRIEGQLRRENPSIYDFSRMNSPGPRGPNPFSAYLTPTIYLPTRKVGVGDALSDSIVKGKVLPFVGDAIEAKDIYDIYAATQRVINDEATPQDLKRLLEFDNDLRRGSTFWGNTTNIVAQMPAFAGELALTVGLYAAGKEVTVKLTLAGLKKAMRAMLGKKLGSVVASVALKAEGKMVGAAVQSLAAMAPRTIAESIRNMTPGLAAEEGADGEINLVLGREGDGFAEALAKAGLGSYLSVLTEHSGEAIGKVLDAVPGSGKLEALKSYVASRWLRQNPGSTLRQFTGKLAEKAAWDGVIAEIGEEELEKALRYATRLDDEYKVTTPKEFLQELVAFSMVPAATGVLDSALSGRYEAQKSQDQKAFFLALGDTAKRSKLVERLPEQAQRLVGMMTKDGPVENIYVPLEMWTTYWQEQGADPRDMAEDVLGSADRYDEAVRSGHDLIIPTSRYAVKIAPTSHNDFFADEIRTSATGMSAREASDFLEELEAQQQAAPETPDEGSDSAARVRQDVMGQLLGAGTEHSTSEKYASLYESTFRSLGRRANLDPFDLYNRYGLRITRELPDVLKRVSNVEALDILIDRVRSGDIFSPLVEGPSSAVVDPATLPPVEKQDHRAVDPSWRGRTLYAWKSPHVLVLQKGTQAKGDKGRKTRTLPLAWQREMERVPKDAKRLIARLRQYSDEVFEVQGTHGGFYLAPRGLADLAKKDLPDWETDVQEAKKRRERRREKKAGVVPLGPAIPELADLQGLLRDLEIDLSTTDNEAVKEAIRRATPVDGEAGQSLDQSAAEAAGLPENPAPEQVEDAKRQYDAVKLVTDDQGRLLAPNGTPSNLTEAQWRTVRTPFFKRWFGDWETAAKLKDHGPVPVVVVQGDEVSTSEDPRIVRREIETWARANLRGGYRNDQTGWTLNVGRRSINEMFTHADDADSPRALVKLVEVIKNAVHVATSPHKPISPDFIAVHHLYAPVSVAGRPRLLRLVVKELSVNARKNVYDVIGVEMKMPDVALTPQQHEAAENVPPSGNVSIGSILAQVKPEHRASKVVDANGEPLVVYHGTGTSITAFDPSFTGKGNDQLGSGFYFTTSTESASGYQAARISPGQLKPGGEDSPNTVAAYLSIKNPIRVGPESDNLSDVTVTPRQAEAIIAKAPDVFDPELSPLTNWIDRSRFTKSDIREVAKNYNNLLTLENDFFRNGATEFRHAVHDVMGFDGVEKVFPDGEKHYVAFFPEQIKSATGNRGTFDPNDPNILHQNKRGSLRIGPNRQMRIDLLKHADLSTFLHETGHFYLEVLHDLAASPDAPKQLADDYQTVRNWLGAKGTKALTTEQHEKFARGFEAYLMEGKAPSAGLRKAFASFRAWLLSIYRTLARLNAELTPEVRGVMDRLLAADEEIAEAERSQNATPLFADAESARMTDEEFSAYQESVDAARLEARDQLAAASMEEITREQQKWWKSELEKTRREVADEVNSQPVYIAISILQTGKMPDGSDAPNGLRGLKLDKQALVNAFGADILDRLPIPYVYANTGGVPPDVAATMLGFPTDEQLVLALANARPRQALIDGEADVRMRDRYGDMLLDGTAPEKAVAAVYGEKRAELLIAELGKLARRSGTRRVPPLAILRAHAESVIAGKPVREITPGLYQKAARDAAQNAFEALAGKDYERAFEEKQRELLNLELFREATRAKEKADDIAAYLAGFNKLAARQRIGKAGADYLEQIDAILERFEFRRVSNKAIDRRKALAEWVAEQDKAGEPVEIDDAKLIDATRKNYRELTFEELSGVHDAVKSIAHLATVKNKLLKVQADRELSDAVNEVVSTVEAHSKGPREVQIGSPTAVERAGNQWRSLFALLRKVSFIVREMDGDRDGGPIYNLLTRPLNDAANTKAVMNEEAAIKLNEIFKDHTGAEMNHKKFREAVGRKLSKKDILMVALNWGNADNRHSVMSGYGWSEQQVKGLLDTLDEKDWKFVQSVWDFVNSYWPAIKAKQERVYGVAPEKVEAMPIETRYGTFAGGYFPLKYKGVRAAQQSAADAADHLKRGAFARATTRRGHTIERLHNVNRPVLLEFSVLFSHVGQVIHDLTHHETILDLGRIIGHRDVAEAIARHYGEETYRQITSLLTDVAAGDVPVTNTFERSVNWLRKGATISVMSWNAVTSMMQPLGLTQSIVRVGPEWVAKGVGKWMSSAATWEDAVKKIHEQSSFMRLRHKTYQRDINEIQNKIGKGKLNNVTATYFYFISKAQMIADIPTWLGAYEKAYAEKVDEVRAIALADQAVIDSQGGGQIKDLAAIERGGPLMKIFTNFYSFFSSTLNLTVASWRRTDFRNPLSIGRLAVDMLLLYTVPALLGEAIRDAVVGGGDDDESWAAWAAKNHAAYLLNTIPLAREASGFAEGYYGYKGPSGLRFFAELGNLSQQAAQGEFDESFYRSLNRTGGIFFHYPSTALERAVEGMEMIEDGEGTPLNIVTGKPYEK